MSRSLRNFNTSRFHSPRCFHENPHPHGLQASFCALVPVFLSRCPLLFGGLLLNREWWVEGQPVSQVVKECQAGAPWAERGPSPSSVCYATSVFAAISISIQHETVFTFPSLHGVAALSLSWQYLNHFPRGGGRWNQKICLQSDVE